MPVSPAWSQFPIDPKTENPVFVDESPAVAEGLTRVREHMAAGNPDQAVRTLQKILDEHADGFVVSETDPSLFESVRGRVHKLLLGNPGLMAKYRDAASASARQMLEAGGQKLGELERTRLMTPEGLTSALQTARRRVLEGQFDGAALVLLELVNHPDRQSRAKEVAEAALLAARYQTAPAVRKQLAALLNGQALPPQQPMPSAGARSADGNDGPTLGNGSASPLVDELVNQALGSGEFDTKPPIQPLTWRDEATLDQLPQYARELRYWPVIGDRAVYVSTGAAVSAFDRVSMRRLWIVEAVGALKLPGGEQEPPQNGLRMPSRNTWEEVVQPVLTAGSSLLVAVVGRDFDSSANAEGMEYLAAFDAVTGAVRYAVPLRGLDEQLADSNSRGPLVSDGRVVVVNLLKRQNQRRLLASVLVGVEATTGKRLWTRVVGSAGVLPFFRTALTDSTVAGGGVVYRYDRLGTVGAYTIAEGRPLWVRRMSSKVVVEMQQPQDPWLVHQPLLTPAGLVMMSPDHDEVMVADPASGQITARRKAADLREPGYLVATATHLVAVGTTQVATLRLDQIETGSPKFSGRLGGKAEEIRGRVTVAGSQVLVPSAAGVTVIDPENPAKPLRSVKLDAPGSPLTLPEGLLVVDDARVHMYCTWQVAAAHLKEQIASSPLDAGPGAELLKLAERADKPAEVLPAADSALAALAKAEAAGESGRDPLAPEQRSSVVATLLRAVNRSIGLKVDDAGVRLDDAGIDGALARAATAAQTPWDQVAVLLVKGDVSEKRRQWADAAAAYQQITEGEALGAASAPGSGSGSSAATVAVDRLTRVLKPSAGGRAAYAEFDRRFDEAEAKLPPSADVGEMEKLAGRFPLARGVPGMWLRTAKVYGAAKTPQGERAQARALERGVQAAERAGDADPLVVGELNGTLVHNLLGRGLLLAAADALARAQNKFPGTALSAAGAPLAVADITATIQRELTGARHWPRVGAPRSGDGVTPQVIDGWVLMEPMIKGASGVNPPFIVLRKGDEHRTQVALFGLKPGQLAGDAAEGSVTALAELWFSQSGGDSWWLVRVDNRGALFFVGEQNGGRLVRVDADSGKVAWQTEPFGALFPTDPPARFGGQALRNAILGETRSTEIVIAADERTVCMVERAGRCAAIDADTGQLLWTSRLPITRIADATVNGGQLIAVGEFAQPQADNKLDRLALFDARTGTQLAVTAAPLTGVRYIRTTSRGDLILGAGGTIVAINAADLETAKPAWTLTAHPAASAWEAWLLDDRLFLLGDDRSLWEVSAVSGAPPAKPIDMQGRLDARTAITAWQSADGTVAFATGRGMALISGNGTLQGVDAVNSPDGTVLPVVTEGAALLLTPQQPRQSGGMLGEGANGSPTVWNLHRLETAGAQLLSTTPVSFATPPIRMAAIDGRIAISTSSGTVVLDAPKDAK